MKLTRNSIFETNSSSTHSLTISRREYLKVNNIPRNSSFFEVDEYGVAYGGDESISIHKINTECDKLSFMLNVLATVCDRRWNGDKMFIDYSYEDMNRSGDTVRYLDKYWDEMINSDIFVALKEAIFEVTNTIIFYKRPRGSYESIPFYETIYLDDGGVEDLFHIADEFDKEDFKSFVKDVIFNKDIIITDSSIPYGFEGDFE